MFKSTALPRHPPKKTNMAMENHQFLIGDTSLKWLFCHCHVKSCKFWGCKSSSINLFQFPPRTSVSSFRKRFPCTLKSRWHSGLELGGKLLSRRVPRHCSRRMMWAHTLYIQTQHLLRRLSRVPNTYGTQEILAGF